MKSLSYIVCLVIMMFSCKEDKRETAYPISLIEGSWKLKARLDKDASEWRMLPDAEQQIIRFRNDGVMLNKDNKASCCLTFKYRINEVEMKLSLENEIPYVTGCELVDCWACQEYKMTVENDTLIIDHCDYYKEKYQRL